MCPPNIKQKGVTLSLHEAQRALGTETIPITDLNQGHPDDRPYGRSGGFGGMGRSGQSAFGGGGGGGGGGFSRGGGGGAFGGGAFGASGGSMGGGGGSRYGSRYGGGDRETSQGGPPVSEEMPWRRDSNTGGEAVNFRSRNEAPMSTVPPQQTTSQAGRSRKLNLGILAGHLGGLAPTADGTTKAEQPEPLEKVELGTPAEQAPAHTVPAPAPAPTVSAPEPSAVDPSRLGWGDDDGVSEPQQISRAGMSTGSIGGRRSTPPRGGPMPAAFSSSRDYRSAAAGGSYGGAPPVLEQDATRLEGWGDTAPSTSSYAMRDSTRLPRTGVSYGSQQHQGMAKPAVSTAESEMQAFERFKAEQRLAPSSAPVGTWNSLSQQPSAKPRAAAKQAPRQTTVSPPSAAPEVFASVKLLEQTSKKFNGVLEGRELCAGKFDSEEDYDKAVSVFIAQLVSETLLGQEKAESLSSGYLLETALIRSVISNWLSFIQSQRSSASEADLSSPGQDEWIGQNVVPLATTSLQRIGPVVAEFKRRAAARASTSEEDYMYNCLLITQMMLKGLNFPRLSPSLTLIELLWLAMVQVKNPSHRMWSKKTIQRWMEDYDNETPGRPEAFVQLQYMQAWLK